MSSSLPLPTFASPLLVTCTALLLAAPASLGAAVYLTTQASLPMRRRLRALLEVAGAVPSVIHVFVAVVLLAPALPRAPGAWGTFDAVAAGLALGVLLAAPLTLAFEVALAGVPAELREAALALGATSGRTVARIHLPAARPALFAALLERAARTLGETTAIALLLGLPLVATGVALVTASAALALLARHCERSFP